MAVSKKIKKRDYRALWGSLSLAQFRQGNRLLFQPFALCVLKAQLNLLFGPIHFNQTKVVLCDEFAQTIGAVFFGRRPSMCHAARGYFVQGIALRAAAFVDGTNVPVTG